MSRVCLSFALCVMAAIGLPPRAAYAEPYLAVQQGYKCVTCHVNPTGGGLRNDFGLIFAQNVMPARTLPASVPTWTGKITSFLRLGGDLRASWNRDEVPNNPAKEDTKLRQVRLYADLAVVPDRLSLYVDEYVAPEKPEEFEGYVFLNDPTRGWYLKGGKFYLPFGFRLQDQTAFVRELSGISMTTPDTGVELGLERPNFSAQLDYSNDNANSGAGSRHQLTGQLVWVQTRYRLGTAASFTSSDAGNRRVGALFAGLRTGPVAWLGEADLVHDEGFPEGARSMLAALGELNWAMRKGQNLKLTAEYNDPDRSVHENQNTRWSVLYELTPLPFVQLRAGYRYYSGIRQNDFQNRKTMFLEFHAFM